MEVCVKTCKKHGPTTYILVGGKKWRCKQCRNDGVTRNRQKRKKRLVDHFGGKCYICGYDKCQQVLHFHHIDPQTKEFGLGNAGICRSWERMKAEAEKCVLLCANCHGEVENGITALKLK